MDYHELPAVLDVAATARVLGVGDENFVLGLQWAQTDIGREFRPVFSYGVYFQM